MSREYKFDQKLVRRSNSLPMPPSFIYTFTLWDYIVKTFCAMCHDIFDHCKFQIGAKLSKMRGQNLA